MAWFKVDDQLYSHPKWLAVSPRARGLWITAGSWCSAQLTDGHIPSSALPMLGGQAKDARELVESGLWVENGNGWFFHDWLDMQPSKEKVEAEREAARERMQNKRRNGGDDS